RRRLEALLAPEPRLLVRGGALHLLAFRPRGGTPGRSERWSQTTRAELLRQGVMLSRPLYRGHAHLKAVLGNPHTRTQELERLARCVRRSLADC
ncbi:MAG: aspartate aminotransferase family protein, partial [Synechococcaceae cyanobacterium]|nr:aspartate aminotransferase family protein [Synechococcaceae cyanobacterium]